MKYNQVSLENFLGDFQSQINPSQSQIKIFKEHLATLHKTDPEESEEHHKNEINDFLKNTFAYKINTRNKIDAAIYEDNQAQVIIEAKSLKNKGQFPKNKDSLESKAFYESILYYLRESRTGSNNNIKYIILCNLHSFYIIDAKEFHKCFAKDREIDKFFKNVDKKEGNDTTTDKFYEEIRQYLPNLDKEISYTCFELTNIQDQDIALIYAVLSPTFLLKRKSYIDANTLNQGFYDELLYILGLCEKIESGKIIIVPSDTQNTFLHSITQNLGFDKEKDFEEIFSLLTIWNNRILFLRLLESMLLSFGHIKKPFLDLEAIADFKVFNQLFFDVLAREEDSRTEIPRGLEDIPYLNSSLFEKTPLESENGKNKQIKSLDSKPLKLYKTSILKQNSEYKNKDSLPLLEYLFAFLHSYDFTTTPKDIENHTKMNFDKLINSAVLGLVFEKLNGYKEGSFYTPSFITAYMCRESITKAVIDKFNTTKNWNCKTLDELYNKIEDIEEANKIFHSITICDPAVGSGHFLVSALNELIYIKYKLGILCDAQGLKLKNIILELINDEMVIRDSNGDIYSYTIPAHQEIETHKIQKAIFYTKKNIIENCLFGVDINPNSCEITRLRLWIELLKYSYYKDIANKRLETLPNIDINIKAGNSLLSNFPIDSTKDSLYKNMIDKINDKVSLINREYYEEIINDIQKKFTPEIKKYNEAVKNYKNQTNKYLKDADKDTIKKSQDFFKKLFLRLDPCVLEFRNELGEYANSYGYEGFNLKEETSDLKIDDIKKLESFITEFEFHKTHNIPPLGQENGSDYKTLKKLIDLMQRYENLYFSRSFEWRFEFPEVLDENGDFVGFDLVIGNPPYGNFLTEEQKKSIKTARNINLYNLYNDCDLSETSSLFTKLGAIIINNNSTFSFITTFALVFSLRQSKIREFLKNYFQSIRISTFDRDGCPIFDAMSQSVCIIIAKGKNLKNQVYETSIFYRHKVNLDSIEFKSIKGFLLTEKGFSSNFSKKHRLPKIGNDKNIFILDKIKNNTNKLENILKNGEKFFYRTSGNYWYNAFLDQPYKSTEIKTIYSIHKNFVFLLINSNFFYWWSRIYGDGRHNNSDIMRNIPIPNSSKIIHYELFLKFLTRYHNKKMMSIFDSKNNRFETSKIKPSIDLIDLFLLKFLYDFDLNMITYIINYDSNIRGGIKINIEKMINDKKSDFLKIKNQIENLKEENLEINILKIENDIDILVYKLYNLTDEDIKIIEKE